MWCWNLFRTQYERRELPADELSVHGVIVISISVGDPASNDRANEVDQPGQLALSQSQLLGWAGGGLHEALVDTGRGVKQRDEQLTCLTVLTPGGREGGREGVHVFART